MLEVDVNNILPVTEARAKIANLVDEVMKGNVYVLTRGGKPAVVVAPVDMVQNQLVKKTNPNSKLTTQSTSFNPVAVLSKTELPVVSNKPELPVTQKVEVVQPVAKNYSNNLPAINDQDDDVPNIDMDKINKAIEETEQEQ